MGKLAVHVGSRIRLFRKAHGLTVEQLGARIQKSKATIYKYESGQIPVDVDTLLDIASALNVEPAYFFDLPFSKKICAPQISFFDSNCLYAYYYDGRIKQVVHSLLSFYSNADGEDCRASFFMNLEDGENPELSRYIYSGTLFSHEAVSYFILENVTLPIETLIIELIHPFRTSRCTWGLFLGLSDQPLAPMATKILISKVPLTEQELESYPLVFTKDELKDIREKNALLLSIHR